jgi:acetolactate synthase-1/3 small subunit
MRHTLSILVENRFGELARIVGLFSARGYNIGSLTVAETLDPSISCVTVITSGNNQNIEQIVKQLGRLVRVLKVTDLTGTSHVEREMVLIHVKTESGAAFQKVLSLLSDPQMRVAEVMEDGLILEASGNWNEVNELVRELTPFGIHSIVRTGTVALPTKPSSENDETLSASSST